MKKLLLFSLLIMFSIAQLTTLYAQQRVTGTVLGAEDKEPLPGVSVKVKGTTTGVQTDGDGKFSIAKPAGQNILVFTFIGFVTREVNVAGKSNIRIDLSSTNTELSEVVVTGYGTQKRREFTGSAVTVSGETIKDRPIQSFGQALTGQAAGVNIVQPNGLLNNPPVIRIRGVNSISLSSFPLIVVDGIPISTGDVTTNSAPNNPLADINPSDIESMDILKDAASTAIYGSRGANGVILITTKKGKLGKTKVTYDGWFGVNNAVRLPGILNAQEYMDYKNEAVRNAVSVNPALVPASQRDANNQSFFPAYNADGSLIDTKWYDVIYRTAYSQNHSVTISGATEATSYYISGGLTDQDGFLQSNSFGRKSARFNLTHKVTNWMSLTGNVNYNNSISKSPSSGSLPGAAFSSAGLGRIAVALSPNVSPRTPDGNYNLLNNTIGNNNNLFPQQWNNPLPLIELDKNSSESNRIIANVGADITLYKGLKFNSTYSFDRNRTENEQFWNPYQGDGFTPKGQAYNSNGNRNNWNWTNTLNYLVSINEKHNISALAGTEIQRTDYREWGGIRQGLTDYFFDQYQGSYATNVAGGNGIGLRSYQSYFGRLNYNYAGRYFVSANFRRDGNSALALGKKFGNFGGASLGWTVSEEEFFKNSSLAKIVSTFRLKGSYGKVGNGNLTSDYGSYSLYGAGNFGDLPSLAYNQAGNQNLQWETSKQTNVGFNLAFLNDRITFEANYYKNNIDNLILAAPQAPSKGIPGNSILTNIGSMYNQGLEFTVAATPINKGKFSWSTNFNFTTNKNKVTELVTENSTLTGITGLENTNITKVGESVGSIFTVKTAGINPANGRRIFVAKDGRQVQYLHGGENLTRPNGTTIRTSWSNLDGTPYLAADGIAGLTVSGSDATVINNALPTWYGGFTNTFRYGNFDLSFLMTFSGGNYIYNGSKAGLRDQRAWNNSTDVLGRWTAAGQQTDIPRAIFGDNISNGSSFAIDVNAEKADFLRMQNAVIGYRLPSTLFGKTGITGLRIYAQVNNAFLITNYTGVDPEVSVNGNSTNAASSGNIAPGVERNNIPQGRAFTFGLNLSF